MEGWTSVAGRGKGQTPRQPIECLADCVCVCVCVCECVCEFSKKVFLWIFCGYF